MLWLSQLLDALVAIPKIGDMVSAAVTFIVQWWANKQTAETMAKVADAAALSARAKTQEERYAALEMWRSALSRPRITVK